MTYPTDPYTEKDWPQGFGQLTQVGMRQHYELGQYLRRRYKDFLNSSYDRHQIYVRSTDVDRTLMSAESDLAGLYPPHGHQIFNPDVNWQPIPVHTVPEKYDK
ncbi:lysosomal acid phosphatase-like, partial [Heterodontus francisci]|uniref:lysosomal acid phosphatase-like n=1 Tax=Heterodontus francisci TaxID=7792 RepID=UPI00355BF3C7